jgi:hypothetical protein
MKVTRVEQRENIKSRTIPLNLRTTVEEPLGSRGTIQNGRYVKTTGMKHRKIQKCCSEA